MSNDIDTALEAEVTRRAIALGIATRVPGERSRAARLAARLYAGATAVQRSRIVTTLCRPLGPLALVAVASGAFAGLLGRASALGGALQIDELAGFTRDQVFELARFVEQVSPEALQQVAGGVAENPWGVSALGAAAAVLLATAARRPDEPRGRRPGGLKRRSPDNGAMSAADDATPPDPAAPHPRWHFRVLASTAATLRLWIWAAAAGAAAAASTLAFRWLTLQIEWLGTGQSSDLVEAARAIPAWQRPIVCAIGGALAGGVLQLGARWVARGRQGDHYLDYIDAARQGRVDLNDRANLVRTVSAALSIGTGASIGREGPMVQLAAWASAWLARVVPIRPEQRSAIMVCGIAAGIAAAYHAPVAGVVFVLELALGFFARHTVAPVLIAAGTASALVYVMVDPRPLYVTTPIAMLPSSILFTLVASVAFGGFGWGFLLLVERSRALFARLHSPALRLAVGGLLVGALSAFVPEVWGNGYSAVERALGGTQPWQWLALVLVTKVVATSWSSGSGAIGGMFTPSLFVGAAAGGVLAQLAALWLPTAWVGDPRSLVVIGMAAVLTAATHAPLMAITMVLEMTNEFQLTVPVMLACAVSYAISTQFGAKPLYGNPIEAVR